MAAAGSGGSREKQKADDQAIARRFWPALGYDGSYNRVAGLRSRLEGRPGSRKQQNVRAAAYSCRLRFFCPGEAFQFDWSEDWAIIGRRGGPSRRSLTSSSPTGRAFILPPPILSRTHEMLFDAHNHAFRVLGGVSPGRGNLRQSMGRLPAQGDPLASGGWNARIYPACCGDSSRPLALMGVRCSVLIT